jgi:hypothetical protein
LQEVFIGDEITSFDGVLTGLSFRLKRSGMPESPVFQTTGFPYARE